MRASTYRLRFGYVLIFVLLQVSVSCRGLSESQADSRNLTAADKFRMETYGKGVLKLKRLGGDTAPFEEDARRLNRTFEQRGIESVREELILSLSRLESVLLQREFGIGTGAPLRPVRNPPRLLLDQDWVQRGTPLDALRQYVDKTRGEPSGDPGAWADRAVGLAILYRRLGEEEYARRAHRAIVYAGSLDIEEASRKYPASMDLYYAGFLQNAVFVHDACRGAWSEAQRKALEARMVEVADFLMMLFVLADGYEDFNNHKVTDVTAIGLAGLALLGENPRGQVYASFAKACYVQRFFPAWDLQGADGGWHEGFSYSNLVVGPAIFFLGAWERTLDEKLWTQSKFLENFPRFVVHHASMRGYLEPFADCIRTEEPEAVGYICAEIGRIYGTRWGAAAADLCFRPSARGRDEQRALVEALWGDRESEVRAAGGDGWDTAGFLRGQVPSAHFTAMGRVCARDNWQEGALRFTLGCSDHFGGHDHMDAGHVSVYGPDGGYALESGHYDGWQTDHWGEHYQRTVAHNTVAVLLDEPSTIDGRMTKVLDDGGQPPVVLHDQPKTAEQWRARRADYDRGDITAFEDRGEYCWTRANAAPAYKGRLSRFVRTLVLLRSVASEPAALVWEDRIQTGEKQSLRWMLHPGAGWRKEGTSIAWGRMKMTWLTPEAIREVRHDRETAHPPKKTTRLAETLPDGRLEWILSPSTAEIRVVVVFHAPNVNVSLSPDGKRVTVGKRTVELGQEVVMRKK